MKKIFKLIIAIATIFVFSFVKIKADDGVTFSCDYQVGDASVRIKVVNLEKKYIKDTQTITKEDASNLKKYIKFFYLNSNNMYEEYTGTGGIKNFKGYNNNKMQIFSDIQSADRALEVKNFLTQATSSHTSVNCPSVYSYVSGEPYNRLTVTSFSTHTATNEYGYESTVSHTATALISQNCYKDSTSTTAISCSTIDVGDLRNDDEKECVYTANGSNKFKLIYNRTNNTLDFDKLGAGYPWTEAFIPGTWTIADDKLIAKFKPAEGSEMKCPSKIVCSCSAFNGCYFNSDKHVDDDCGNLVTDDGVDTNTENNNNGNKPSIPDIDFSDSSMSCEEILGTNLTKIIRLFFLVLRIVGAIITILQASIKLIPAIVAKDAEGLKKAGKSCITLAIILLLIALLPSLVTLIGNIIDLDTSCFI